MAITVVRPGIVAYRHPLLKGKSIQRGIGKLAATPAEQAQAVRELEMLVKLRPTHWSDLPAEPISKAAFAAWFSPVRGEWVQEWRDYQDERGTPESAVAHSMFKQLGDRIKTGDTATAAGEVERLKRENAALKAELADARRQISELVGAVAKLTAKRVP